MINQYTSATAGRITPTWMLKGRAMQEQLPSVGRISEASSDKPKSKANAKSKKKSPYTPWLDKTQKAFVVDAEAIKANKHDLSINRYKEVIYEEEQYESPKKILKKLKKLEMEILSDLDELEGML